MDFLYNALTITTGAVMGRIEKTVFISYRRTNFPWALAVYQDLTARGYDVFFDFLSIPSGDFETVILENIRGRAHFIVILTPSALERCAEPGDWLRREIEAAMDEKRNIVPLMLESFDFGSPATVKALTGKLKNLQRYNALKVPAEYFMEAMERLRKQYLNVPLDAVVHPVSESVREVTEEHQAAAGEAKEVGEAELTAQEWFEKGYVFAVEAKNFAEAIRCFSEAIRLQPDYAEAYNNRGAARKDNNDLQGALADYDEAIRLKPDDAIAYYNRGTARKDNNDLQGALADYDEAIRLKPDDAIAYYNRGFARSDNNDLQGALADYDEAIRLKPDLADAYYNRGLARKASNDLQGALADYDEAIRLMPDDATAYYNRGLARRDNNDLKGALADFDEAIRLKSEYAEAYNNRGAVHRDNHDLQGALADFDEAIRLKSDYAEAYNNRGAAHSDNHDLQGALADYDEAIRLKPDDAIAYYNRGLVRRDNKDLQGALADYDEAIRLKPDDAIAYYNRGLVRSDNNDLQGALADYDEAIRLKPSYANTYHNRGTTHQRMGNFEDSAKDYDEAIRLDPESGFVRSSWISALRKLGRHVEADQQERLARESINKQNEYNQACFEAVCGNADSALELLKTGLEKGQAPREWARQDPDFESIRDDPRFQEIVG
jgi:tetratricopeptide (TPR) repeat protein